MYNRTNDDDDNTKYASYAAAAGSNFRPSSPKMYRMYLFTQLSFAASPSVFLSSIAQLGLPPSGSLTHWV